MKRGTIVLLGVIGGILLFALIILFMYRGSYNTAVSLQEEVDKAWGDVGTEYQRRADLIPNLVETVKGAAANEKDILTKVTNARAGIVNAKTPEEMEMFGKEINTAINLAFEAYPQIKSTENFSKFQNQIEGSENKISYSRKKYNEAVRNYNAHIRGFFNSMFLNSETFPKKESFKEETGAEKATDVKF